MIQRWLIVILVLLVVVLGACLFSLIPKWELEWKLASEQQKEAKSYSCDSCGWTVIEIEETHGRITVAFREVVCVGEEGVRLNLTIFKGHRDYADYKRLEENDEVTFHDMDSWARRPGSGRYLGVATVNGVPST